MEAQVRRDLPWKIWLDRGLLGLGVLLVVTGIGYFFAHNWNHLTNADKLGLAGGAVLVSLLAATWTGLDGYAGKFLLLAASALVGVYLAVFGQVYQTGADSYELFTGWAFLTFPWVALGRFTPLWLFWLGLLNLAVGFYWPLSSLFFGIESFDLFRHETVSLMLLNGFALLLREVLQNRRLPWIDRGWSALVLLAAVLIPAAVETIGEILNTWDSGVSSRGAFLACLLYGIGVAGLGFYYSRWRYSLPALALATLSACTVLTFLVIRVLDFDQSHLTAGTWLLAGLIILAIFGGGVFFLRRQRLSHQQTP
jgi:uncharacterized membrane protein